MQEDYGGYARRRKKPGKGRYPMGPTTKPGQSLDERETSGNKAWITNSWSHLEIITLGGEDNWKQQFVYWREETMIYSLG